MDLAVELTLICYCCFPLEYSQTIVSTEREAAAEGAITLVSARPAHSFVKLTDH